MRILLTVSFLFVYLTVSTQEIHKRSLLLMGSNFEITVVALSKEEAKNYIDEAVGEIKRIEKLISSWDQNSETSLVNRSAGIKAEKVSIELFELIERAIALSRLTDGAFDISYASMDRIWKFDGSMEVMPSEQVVQESVHLVGYENIELNKEQKTVFLKEKGMKIGFGGIGKGYAADRAKELLMKKGVVAGIINASGDMNTWGKQPSGKDWEVAITNPLDKQKAFGLLPIKQGAVVTSGNYEKYVSFEGKRYSHIIDPRSGYPSSGIISVTVFANSAELADALATSVFVMGMEAGINRINQLPKIECIIIDEKGRIHQSENIKIDTQ